MVIARTRAGSVRGERVEAGVAFRGVPYAAPPIGELRWRSPRPVTPWAGVRDATKFGAIAPQEVSPERLAKRGVAMDEDCLSLNVWTPAADDDRRPVVVFLHGGGVVAGAGSAPLFDGMRLSARGDVVVVTVNFRLGALGSLYAPDLLGVDGDLATNLALRDQLFALEWVREEIGAFGGDPDRVTLMGQSSGAVAIACMLAADAATGLFHRVILQSGGLERVRSTAAAADVARQFVAALGGERNVDRLNLQVRQILAAQAEIPVGFVPPVGPFHHSVDGDVVPAHPLSIIAERPVIGVPMLAGTTRDEWRVFDAALDPAMFTDEYLRNRALALARSEADVEPMLDRYVRAVSGGADASPDERRQAMASALVTDFHFTAPTAQFALAHANHGNPVFHYELQWTSPRPGLGACHDTCLPLVFGTMERAPGVAGTGPEAKAMSDVIQDAWIEFIRSSDPSIDRLGSWPRYEAATRSTMLLGAAPRVADHHRADQLAIWEGRYPAAG